LPKKTLDHNQMPPRTPREPDLWLARLREKAAFAGKVYGFRYAGHCMRSYLSEETRPEMGAESVSLTRCWSALISFLSTHHSMRRQDILGNKHAKMKKSASIINTAREAY